MCKTNHSTWKHQNYGRIKSRHRKNQGRRHRNRLQISGHTTKHAEQIKGGKHKVTTTYTKRLRQIFKSRLNAKNKIQAINTCTIPVITYTAGIIDWNKKEIEDVDRMTMKTMNMYGGLHPRADIHRLYLPRKEGGRGLREVASSVRCQCAGLQEYISKAKEKDPVIEAVWKHQAIKGCKSKNEEMDEWEVENTTKWISKQLHGQYKQQVLEITSMENAYTWMWKSTGLKMETEAIVTAAQDHALDTKCHKAKILHTSNDPKCRMCKEKYETVAHIVSACSKIAGSLDKTRHNNVAAAITTANASTTRSKRQIASGSTSPT